MYMLRRAGHGCRIVYYLRTTPQDFIQPFIREFDDELRSTFEHVLGLIVSDEQWEQASYGVKSSGLGLCRASDVADAAYLASRYAAYDDCEALDSEHVWDDGMGGQGAGVVGGWLGGVISCINDKVPNDSAFPSQAGAPPECVVKQSLIVGSINTSRREAMLNRAGMWDKVRINAAGALHAGSWLDASPNMALNRSMGSLAGWVYRCVRSAHARFVRVLWTSGELIVKAAWPGGIRQLIIIV